MKRMYKEIAFCPSCRSRFERKHRLRKYCDDCKKKSDTNKKKYKQLSICKSCGNKFEKNHANRIHCFDCSKRRNQ